MLHLDTFETRMRIVMEALAEAAVVELCRLVSQFSANSAAAGARAGETGETGATWSPAPGEQRSITDIRNQFSSLMEAFSRGAMEKILMILKVSMCEASPVEQRAALDDESVRKSTNPKPEQSSGPRKKSVAKRFHQKGKKIQEGFQPALKNYDHIYCREEQQTDRTAAATTAGSESDTEPDAAVCEESDSGLLLAIEVVSPKPVPESAPSPSDKSGIKKKKTKAGLFKCPSCGKTFVRKCLMERHNLTHTKPHSCPQCGKRFSVIRGLIAHSVKHTGKKAHKCLECGTEFAYKSTLDRHMRRHTVEKPVTCTCPLCETPFSGKLEFQRHRCAALKKTFVCSLCPETFECRQRLADHENLHSGVRDFVCEICGDGFLSLASLAIHRVTHMQKKDCCDILGLGCSDMRVLKNHLSKHTGEKLFTCEICGKGCSHQSALKHHMLTHTGERSYICETCGKRCSHASALQNHMRIHTGRKPGEKPSCSICSKIFSSTVKLKYHMSVHTGEKPYACNQCEKKFTNPSNLNMHKRIHSGEKMYGCNICGRRFTQSSSLKLHRRIHTGEMVFHCTVCTKGFLYRKDLKNHMKGHLPAEAGDGEAEKTVTTFTCSQ
ncbi:zinc finger protein 260-like isoform X2 [Cololabis saira]|uniref:zinc finger protein 260-like isoform X2 n=1 Tax=Cololabis saira TaxID=129043 RepID=UPI002AD324FC|nr:zinc finger protein 260-like isoform X2 [Cololabis saira]